ncbi:MAG: O-antigen ligase C-terminal domain-containing protein [Burkholderiales bacterium]|nr:O-antigen ligase C-terminal domain-containing protein [Burkholderiales bacterium]
MSLSSTRRHSRWGVTALSLAAACSPSLLAYNQSPSPTFLNQALALALWGAFVLVSTPGSPGRGVALLLSVPTVVALGVLWSWLPGSLPASLAFSALGLLFAAGVLACAGAAARRDARAAGLFTAFATAWVIAGLLNMAVALVQVFAPHLADGDWIASTSLAGRAVGNLRQPNHLSSLLLWSTIATVALVELGALSRRLGAALVAIFVFGVVLTASRTGLLSVVLLAIWGAVDRRLAPRTRILLLAAPLLYALAWAGMDQWAKLSQSTFGGAVRAAEDAAAGSDISSARFAIWAQTLALIRESPWAGVGFGEFNFAWTLTPFTDRPRAFFDHTHNLPLHLAVELGLPLAAAVMALLLAALWRAARQAWRAPARRPDAGHNAGPDDTAGARAGVLMVLMIGLHSLLEYPLWYSYFLLPAAWVWGYALGKPAGADAHASAYAHAHAHAGSTGADAPLPARPSLVLNAAAAAVVLGTALAIVDYTRVVAIFDSAEGEAPLAERIERGRRSLLFSHHADYAAVTSGVAMRDAPASFANTTHYLLDSRLMIAWAEWLEAQGRHDLARHLAARLREFRSPDAAEFFAPCQAASAPDAAATPGVPGEHGVQTAQRTQTAPATPMAAAPAAAAPPAPPLPFQCRAPQRTPHWREYLPARPAR